MGGAVAAFGPVAIGLLPEHVAVGAGQNRAKRMVAGVARAAGDVEGPSQQLLVGLPLRHETLLRAAESGRARRDHRPFGAEIPAASTSRNAPPL